MAVKRSREQQTATMKTIKKLRQQDNTNPTMPADRLSNLPESLQLQILSSLETKDVFRTSLLSKSWASTWTGVPVLNFSSYSFKNFNEFDKFVFDTLSARGSAKLDKLIFKRGRRCCAKILNKVFDYAFSHGVKELEASIINSRNDSWPMLSNTTSDTLTSLKLDSNSNMGCSFLGPRSGAFKNLHNLYLKRVVITDLDPFSGFPALKKLTLAFCHLQTHENTLNVHAPQLEELTISYYSQYVNLCELTTPNLKYFECRGNNFPRLVPQGGLPVLDTVVIDYNGFCDENQWKTTFDDLMMLFDSLRNARSLTVFSSVVQLLSFFPDELENRCSVFRSLKCLKLDFSFFYCQRLFGVWRSFSEVLRLVPSVKGYLLQKSHDVKCTMIDPCDRPSSSSSHVSETSRQWNTIILQEQR